ncbi:MAG TPA: oligosaccharide flippase family protein [Pyrinomonadaceae bacterium]|jgi:O-antigen/teichoic acid export membrane protein|nr:oligosaccharide flippase family protein [Pyrinomonadaceae bacterium]
MSRTNKFLGGIGFGYASQIITTLIGFWLTPFLLHHIGQHNYGLWLVGTQLMFYLALLDVGIVALLPRETAFATGRARSTEEATELPLIFGHTVRLILWQMPFVVLGALVAWFMMPSDWEGLRNPIGVVLLTFVVTFPLRIFRAVLQGLQDLAYLGRTGIICYLISTGTTVALVLAGWGLYALAIGWTVQQFASAVTGWYRLRTHFPTVMPSRLPAMPWSTAKTRLTQGGWVSLSQIAQVLLNGTDILIIGKLFGPAAVVPFVITGKLINVLANQPQMLMASAGPALSQMRMAESKERLSGVCIALSQAMLMVSGAVVCVVLAVNQGFVGRWVGAGQFGGSWLTVLILLTMLLRHWNLTIASALFYFGRERRLCVTALLDGLVGVGAIFFFVKEFGLIGAPLGAITGVCVVSLPLNLWALAHEGNLSVRRLLKPLLPWFARFVFLAACIVAVARIWIPSSFPLLALTAGVTATIYLALMFPLALRAPLGDYVRPRLFPIRTKFFRLLRVNSFG